jgi:DNA-binding PadR family transcriptional regulator
MTSIYLDSFSGALGELKRGHRSVLDGLRALDRDARVSTWERGTPWLERLLRDLLTGGYIEELDEPYPWYRYAITDKGRALLAQS